MAKINIDTPQTKSFNVLKISKAAWDEIEIRLRLRTDESPFHLMHKNAGDLIDMNGICLAIDPAFQTSLEPITDLKTLLDESKK